MGDKVLGVGIVGCGIISDIHAAALKDIPAGNLVSIFSRSPEKATAFAEKYKIKAATDWRSFIEDPALDLAIICTPNGTHLDLGRKIADAGKHVVVEKPLEVTTERAEALIDHCERRGVTLSVIYQNRYIPDVRRMHEIVENGDIGTIFMASAYVKWYRSQEYYDADAWRGTNDLEGGGVLINQAIHTIDLLQWMAGRVTTVMGTVRTVTHRNIEVEDNAVAAIQFESGAMGVLEASTSVVPAAPRRMEIHGDKGTAVLEGDTLQVLTESEQPIREKSALASGASSPLAGFSTEPHRRQLAAIVHAIQHNEQPPVSGLQSLKSLAIVQAIYRSSAEKRPVTP